jgi:hypothetical protein
MRRFPLSLFLLLTFAVAVGDFAFRTWYPSTLPEYSIGGVVHPLVSPNGDETKKHLYLRRSWYLSESPERAWLQVLGHEGVEVWVNGENVGRSPRVGVGRAAGLVTDISTYLHKGHNAIAIHVLQLTIDRPPAVALEGQLEYPDGSQVSLADPGDWRASDIYDHHGLFWYETEFDDANWAKPKVAAAEDWHTQVDVPPRAVTETRHSQWINPAKADDGAAAMARSFDLAGTPRDGWLRVIATGPYRVAINGWLVADDQADLAAEAPVKATERTFDVSAFLKSGANNVAVMVTTPGEAPRLRADLEAATANDSRTYVGTDQSWKSIAGSESNWVRPDFNDAAWQPCTPELGYQGVVPHGIEREMADIHPSIGFWLGRTFADFGFMVICGLAAWIGCYAVGWLLPDRDNTVGELRSLPFVALVPSAVLAAAAGLATWDLDWTGHDIYQPRWVIALAALVAAQWLVLLLVAALWPRIAAKTITVRHEPRRRPLAIAGIVLCCGVIFSAALWLRLRDIVSEPIHHDEVTCYAFTQAVREYGFPGGQVDPEIPFGWCATSELTYYPTALCSFFFDDPRLVLRIPATVFSMATLVLLAYMGWRWFNPYVAFLVAVLYAISPHTVGMADFGRYLAQVQYFTLLTMYLTYESVRGTGPPPLGLLWGAAISFVAMYLSWEGTGFFGIGLALAVLFQRRRHLRPIFACPSFYYASAVVGLVVLGQNAHRVMQQTERLWYGEGINSLTVKPMWKFPFFDPTFFLVNSSWIRDALLPMIGLAAACVLCVRHRWRFPLRFSIICLIVNAVLMSLLLPLRTNRYSYHLVEILLLVCAAAAVASGEALIKLTQSIRLPRPYRWYVAAVAGCVVAVEGILASGWGIRTAELTDYVTSAYDVRQLRNPDWEGITQYLLAHMGKNDALIAIFPHEQNFVMAAQTGRDEAEHKVDYWLESKLIVQATLGDNRQIPLDRRSGAKMLYDVEQVNKLFAEHDRIWYCTMRFGHSKINENIVSQYLREHMDVAYEDFDTALMVRDRNSRPAPIRLQEEESGELASDFYLR